MHSSRLLSSPSPDSARARCPSLLCACRGVQRVRRAFPRSPIWTWHEDRAHNRPQAIIDTSGAICQFTSVRDIQSGTPSPSFPELPTFTQVVAYETGFAALTTAGSVYTWGDERYGACLGRHVSDDNPSDKPGLVTALENLPTGPISKVAAGGYMLAALTAGNDVYLWGGHPGRKTIPTDVTDEPEPFVVDEQDIADVAVGEAHLIVLTTEGNVFVIGENGNGQLGLPMDSAESWSPVELDLRDNRRAVGVAAGPRNSFIIVSEAL